MNPPTLDDVHAARARVYPLVRPTPLLRHPLLTAETGLDIYVKHENHNPTCSFKVRGGLNLVRSLPPAERRGVISASTGNHGQSIAFAAQREGVPCTIVTPRGNNPDKNAAIRAMGGEVIEHGKDFDEAREWVEQVYIERGLRYVHSANEPLLIAGVATYALEIYDELPDVDVLFVPIGGGSGAAGCALVRTALGRRTKIIGVQAVRADAFTRSWKSRSRVESASADTFAEGMATRVTFDLTFDMLRHELEDVVTLTEEELAEGVRMALRATHNLAEGAAAAPLMAAAKLRDRLAGQKVVCVMSGGNIDAATLKKVLTWFDVGPPTAA
jgi:threonine dehydratase